jgi:hypothetical protein
MVEMPVMRCSSLAFMLVGPLLLPAPAAAQVVIGQTDTFQDGTTRNWTGPPPPNQPVNVPTGGPAGAGDEFLRITSTGMTGAGSRLAVLNDQQWSGGQTYSPAVSGISMDLENLGGTPLTVRLAFQDTSSNTYSSTTGFSLPADGTWHHALFSLLDPNMTSLGGSPPFSTALASGIQEMRIIDAAAPAFVGDVIAATLGIDNITAVPEPGSMAMLWAASALSIVQSWRRLQACRGICLNRVRHVIFSRHPST